MKKKFSVTIILFLSITKIFTLTIDDSPNNRFIKEYMVDEKEYNTVIEYEKYIIILKLTEELNLGFLLFKNTSQESYKKYLTIEEPLLDLDFDYFIDILGIYDDFIFIDSGTSLGLRGLDIIDISAKKIIFQGGHIYNDEPSTGELFWHNKEKFEIYVYSGKRGLSEKNNITEYQYVNPDFIQKHKYVDYLYISIFSLKTKKLQATNLIRAIFSQ